MAQRVECLRGMVIAAAAHLRRGGLLLYPTETAYAIGCDATDARAVHAMFALKGRERGKPLPLIVASHAMAEHSTRFTPLARRLAQQHWPGPLTLVLRARQRFPIGIMAPDGSVALRISAHPIARALSRRLGRPVVATSANRSGEPPCYTITSALRSLGIPPLHPLHGGMASGEDDVVIMPMVGGTTIIALDIDALPRRRPSTIVDARGDRPVVLRRGPIRV